LRAARAVAAAAPEFFPRIDATVRANLKLAFGRADPALVRATFRHFAAAAVDLVFFRRLFDPDRFREHFRFEGGGLEHYRKTKARAAVVVSGHFGNWELFGAALRHVGIPVVPVARTMDKAWADRWMGRFRAERSARPIPKKDALPLSMKALKAGQCVGFLMDQSAGRHGIPVPFFGQRALTFVAPAALAQKMKVPLYAGYSTRLGDGIRYRCFAEPVSTRGSIEEVTGRLNEQLESYVRACPEQWWWFHRRFKPTRTEHAGLPLSPAGVPLTE
jgi:KDO2-lipid IV(A) lauroyltransferase